MASATAGPGPLTLQPHLCVVWSSILYKFSFPEIKGHLHFTGTELKSSYLMMGVTSGHSDGHVTLV